MNPMRRRGLPQVMLLVALALALQLGLTQSVVVLAQSDAADLPKPADETLWAAAAGAWDDSTPARLRLVHNDGFLVAAFIESEDGPDATCIDGTGRLTGPDDEAVETSCAIEGPGFVAGERNGDTTDAELAEDDDPPAWTVRFDGISSASFDDLGTSSWRHSGETAAPSWNLTGLVVLVIAIMAIAATALMGTLWGRERRFRDFLARRLFEETRGRVPEHWPEGRHKEKQLFARYVARGKN